MALRTPCLSATFFQSLMIAGASPPPPTDLPFSLLASSPVPPCVTPPSPGWKAVLEPHDHPAFHGWPTSPALTVAAAARVNACAIARAAVAAGTADATEAALLRRITPAPQRTV